MRIPHRLIGFLLTFLISNSLLAQNNTISYQGSLETNGKTVQGTYTITTTLYADKAGTKPVWSDQYATYVNHGIFNLQLGSGDKVLPPSLPSSLWLGVRIGEDAELRPYTPVSSVPSAL